MVISSSVPVFWIFMIFLPNIIFSHRKETEAEGYLQNHHCPAPQHVSLATYAEKKNAKFSSIKISRSDCLLYIITALFFSYSYHCPSKLFWLPVLDLLLPLSNKLSVSSPSSNESCLAGPDDCCMRSQGADLLELVRESVLKDFGRRLLPDECRSFL